LGFWGVFTRFAGESGLSRYSSSLKSFRTARPERADKKKSRRAGFSMELRGSILYKRSGGKKP
ncbi:MAG TPA: hypothetical protein VNX28_14000, partial [Gemmataceae bacterium]|nr:hypothetical protein [Gemmataceae bacterium]